MNQNIDNCILNIETNNNIPFTRDKIRIVENSLRLMDKKFDKILFILYVEGDVFFIDEMNS
jgi:hypothetical protein